MDRSVHETAPGAGAPSGARARLAALGLTLHGPHSPHPPLLAVVTHNGVAYVSGQLPRIDGKITCVGKLGESVSLEQGVEAAGVCALNALSVIESAIGSLKNLPSLENLNLKRVRLSEGAVERLAEFKNLRFLILTGAVIDDQAMKELRKKLPDCIIVAPDGEWLVPPLRHGQQPIRDGQSTAQ